MRSPQLRRFTYIQARSFLVTKEHDTKIGSTATFPSLLLTVEAKDIPTGQTIDVTGTLTLECKDPVLTSSDTVVKAQRE